MILIIGAAASGKREYARSLGFADAEMADAVLNERPVLYNLQDLVERDPEAAPALLPHLLEKRAVICNEVGSGVIPAERHLRDAREAAGRLCILLAQQAKQVVRLVAGIPTVIAGQTAGHPCGCRGLIRYYYGDGVGKTTAALGLVLRAAGCGCRVMAVQFLKSAPCGELDSLARLPDVTVLRCESCGWSFELDEPAKAALKAEHDRNLARALEAAEAGTLDLLVLDEAADALALGLLDEALLRRAVLEKPAALELAVTGHEPLGWLMEAADYVTEMKKIKHPYDAGIAARKGTEY